MCSTYLGTGVKGLLYQPYSEHYSGKNNWNFNLLCQKAHMDFFNLVSSQQGQNTYILSYCCMCEFLDTAVMAMGNYCNFSTFFTRGQQIFAEDHLGFIFPDFGESIGNNQKSIYLCVLALFFNTTLSYAGLVSCQFVKARLFLLHRQLEKGVPGQVT